MPVLMDWLVKGEVIYQQWWGIGTIEDARYVNHRTLELYEAYPDRAYIHSVVNALHQEKTEISIPSARRVYTALDHLQTGWIIVVLENTFLVFLINMVLQLRQQTRFRIHKTLDSSFDFLKETDTTINWDDADWSVVERFEAEINHET